MYSMLQQELSRQAEIEVRRTAIAREQLRALDTRGAVADVDVSIRVAESGDVPELMRLAELDSRPLPAGELLIAEAAGRIRAAVAIDSRQSIADPFVATAELVALLRLRADQMGRDLRSRDRRGLLAALHLRPGRA